MRLPLPQRLPCWARTLVLMSSHYRKVRFSDGGIEKLSLQNNKEHRNVKM